MTKGRTENNRAWEKERRDRLNRSFDVLAKFLPNYDDSIVYSKIEIIQKSILLIKDLQHKLKELLAENHKDILNTILELEEAFKVLIVRNKVLAALLKKCGGIAPPFQEPKIFNYIVTNPLDENDLNELYVKQNGRPPKNAKARTKKKLQTLHDDEEVLQKKKKIKSNKKDEKRKEKQAELADVLDTEKISVPEGKDESTKTKESNSNDKYNDKPSSAILNNTCESKANKQNNLSSPVLATGILLPISNLKKSMNLDSGPIIVVNALPKTSTILPKPVVQKQIAGKIAILPLKSKTVLRKQRIRRTKKEIEQERKMSVESKLHTSEKKDVANEVNESDRNKCDNNQTEDNDMTANTLKDNGLSKEQDIEADSGRIETTEPTLPQPELSNDILASLQIPQNDSNNESLSPTAAFLMSFPVVSAGVRIGEDEQDVHDSPSHQQSHSVSKPASDSNILDNISSLLTTKDYERFVEDAVKNDAPNCQTNEKAMKRSIESVHEKRASSMSFDFQLKPILNPCAELKTVSETGQKTSVTCTSTYLPEIGNLSYKSSPTKKHRKSTNEENFVNVTNVSITQQNLQPLTTLTGTSTVSTEDYIRNHSAMDFMTTSSTTLHNLEPPTKMLKLSEANEQKRTEPTTFENLFLRNSSTCKYSSNSITTSNMYSTIYNYDKAASAVAKSDSKPSLPDNIGFNITPSIPPIVSRTGTMDSSLARPSKVPEKEKQHLNMPQPFAINTTNAPRTATSIIPSSQNQLNSLYSYPNNTITYSSTAIPHLSTNANSSKSFQDTSVTTTVSASIDKSFFKSNHSTTAATDGFYTSLTSIGTTQSNLPQYPSSIMRPNMYTSALSLSSSSNQKALDYAPQTPFTFSLTTPLNTVSNAKVTPLTSCQQSQNYLPSSHSTSYAQDYNPFAFENISSISAPITPYSACREASQFSFSLTSTTNKVTSKNLSQSSFSIDNNFLTDTRVKPITPLKSEVHLEKKLNFKLCAKADVTHQEELKNKAPTQKVEKSVTKQHVNWMTSTTDMQKNEYPIIPPPLDYTQPVSLPNHYLAQPASQLPNSQKNTDIYFAHPIGEENFQWSPNKLIDTPNINSTTLPNLHGDLALNSITPKPQASAQDKSKNLKLMIPSHIQSQQNVASNPTNSYFSVSQLVDHPKAVSQSKPYEDSVLQQKTSKPTSNHSRFKQKDSKKVAKPSSNVSNFTPNIFVESFAYNEPLKQNNSNNYSAEALISMNPSKKETKSISNYTNQSDYCNQLDTYNNMDYLNESNYNYYNNSYFPQIPENEYFCGSSYSEQQFHNKSSRTNVPPTKHLTSIADTSYVSHSSQNNLYTFPHPSGKLCQQSSQYKNSTQLSTSYNQSRSYSNTNKKQFKQDIFPTYDPNSSTNYFTPTLNINTPILPHPPLIPTPSNDDFNYTSHLNYPTSLSKTSTYPSAQQMSENNQGNLMLHGNVGGNAGNLVTNFNLSTICPEINDKTRQQNW